jgi:hypothetical protein
LPRTAVMFLAHFLLVSTSQIPDRGRGDVRNASRSGRPRRFRDVDPTRRGLVLAWFGFTFMFGGLRLLTWAIHVHVAGLGNVSAGGVHLHHYLYGILLLIGVGVGGLFERTPRWHAWMGLAFGIGLALVVDEAALLVTLRNVYWTGEGGASVAVAFILIGVVGSVLAFTRSGHHHPD